MKTTIIFCLLFICLSSIGQEKNPTKEEYLRKSKTIRTTGIVIGSVGTLLLIIGTSMTLSGLSDLDIFTPSDPSEEKKQRTADALAVTGGCLVLTSIPFFFIANHKKKIALGLKSENALQLRRYDLRQLAIPSLSLKLDL